MGYEPQMSKKDIRKLYLRSSCDFTVEPFDEVMEECRKITEKYFSCVPLLFQIGTLIVNNSMVDGVVRNPAFTALSDEPQFQKIVKRLKSELLGGAVWVQL